MNVKSFMEYIVHYEILFNHGHVQAANVNNVILMYDTFFNSQNSSYLNMFD